MFLVCLVISLSWLYLLCVECFDLSIYVSAVYYMFRISGIRFVITYYMNVCFVSYIGRSVSLACITFGAVQTI
jgi:hypothetical protein